MIYSTRNKIEIRKVFYLKIIHFNSYESIFFSLFRLTSNETQWRNQRKQRRQKLLEKSADVDKKVSRNSNSQLFRGKRDFLGRYFYFALNYEHLFSTIFSWLGYKRNIYRNMNFQAAIYGCVILVLNQLTKKHGLHQQLTLFVFYECFDIKYFGNNVRNLKKQG